MLSVWLTRSARDSLQLLQTLITVVFPTPRIAVVNSDVVGACLPSKLDGSFIVTPSVSIVYTDVRRYCKQVRLCLHHLRCLS